MEHGGLDKRGMSGAGWLDREEREWSRGAWLRGDWRGCSG
jgi:hypothetical protein